MANLRESSKGNWTSNGSLENINAGCLQRIADACETMAVRYQSLIDDRDMYKRWYSEEQRRVARLERKVSALRGVITRMKKANHVSA